MSVNGGDLPKVCIEFFLILETDKTLIKFQYLSIIKQQNYEYIENLL